MESRHGRKQKPVRSKARQGFTAVAAIDRGNGQKGSGDGADKHACDVQLHAVCRQPGGPRKTHGVSQFAVNSRASRDHPDEPVQGCVRAEDDQEQDHHGRPDRLRPENQDDLLYMKSRRRSIPGPEILPTGSTATAATWCGRNQLPSCRRRPENQTSAGRYLLHEAIFIRLFREVDGRSDDE